MMGAWIARWRTVLRIARRDAGRHKGRTAVVVAMMMLPVFAGTFLITVVRSAEETPQTMVQTRLGDEAQALLQPQACDRIGQFPDGRGWSCEGGAEAQTAGPEEMQTVLPGGTDLVPRHEGAAELRSEQALIEASWAQTDTDPVPGLMPARTGTDNPGAGEVVLDAPTADRLGVEVGDDVEFLAGDQVVDVTVIGLSAPNHHQQVLLGADTVPDQEPAGWYSVSEPVTWAQTTDLNEHGILVLSREVLLDPPPESEVSGISSAPMEAATVGLIGAVAAIGLIQAVLLIGPAFAVGARRSARDLALVAAAGGRRRDLYRIVLAAGILTGTLAAVAGVALGLLAGVVTYLITARLGMPMPNLVLPTWHLGIIAALALLVGLVAAWMPARGAARTNVVAALAGRRSESAPRKRIPWVGTVLAAAGFAVAALGAARSDPPLLIAGVVGIQLGLVMATGGLIALTARLAPRMRAATRFALRDAQRQRGRTAPATGAVLVAVAGATVAMSYLQSESAAMDAAWAPDAQDGTAYIGGYLPEVDASERAEIFDEVTAVVAEHDVDADITAASVLAPQHGAGAVAMRPQPDPDQVCPEGLSQSERAEDPRCGQHPGIGSYYWLMTEPIVDDGTFLTATGLPGSTEAAQALEEGSAVVSDQTFVWDDGTAQVEFQSFDGQGSGGSASETQVQTLPVHLFDVRSLSYDLVLPPEALEQFDLAGHDVEVITGGLMLTPATAFTTEQIDALRLAVTEVHPELNVQVEGWQESADDLALTLILAGLAMLVALVATGLAVGLAAAESRPDLATLASVGASPRMRRKVAGAQAGVVVLLGTAVGVITGLALAYVLGLWQQQNWGDLWQFSLPWSVAVLAVTLPALAITGAMALTRSRLPLMRRVA